MSNFVSDIFKNPVKPNRPLVRWWWSAMDVTSEELKTEIAEMDEKGFYGCEIQVMGSMDPNLQQTDPDRFYREHRYATEFYFEVVRDVMAECRNRSMIVDLTVGSSWPIGGTCVTPEDSLKTLLMGTFAVEGGSTRNVSLPTIDEVVDAYYQTIPPSPFPFLPPVVARPEMKAEMRRIKVTAARVSGEPGVFSAANPQTTLLDHDSAVDLTDMIGPDNTLTWDFPDGCWQVFIACAGPIFADLGSDAKEMPNKTSLVLDHFKEGAIERLLDHYFTRGNFDEFAGSTFRSFFSDSFELDSQCYWADDFLEQFKQRRGYDLAPYLPVIFVPERDSRDTVSDKGYTPNFDFADGLGNRIRRDYETTVADLFRENLLRGLYRWGEKHGLQSKVQCYGHVMDNLQSFGLAHIPETEQLASGGSIDFMKLAGSAALLYDKPIASAESLVWGDQDYQVNPMKIKVASDRLFVSGVNQMIYHGWPYQHPDAKWPGSFPFHGIVGTFISRNDAIWPWLRTVNDAVARGQYLMQSGQTVVDVAVFDRNLEHQFESGRAEELATGVLDGIDREDGVESVFSSIHHPPRTEWQIMAENSRRLGNDLMEAGYDYVHINEERLLQAELDADGSLCTGKLRIKALIIPDVDFLTLTSAVKLKSLAERGFLILFCNLLPLTVPGYLNFAEESCVLTKTLEAFKPVEQRQIPAELSKSGILPGISANVGGLQHIHKKLGNLDLLMVRSRLPVSRMAQISIVGRPCQGRLLNTWTGTVSPLATQCADGQVKVEMPIAEYGSAYMLFGPEDELPAIDDFLSPVAATAAIRGRCLTQLSDAWSLTCRSAIPAETETTTAWETCKLGDWADMETLRDFSGVGTYRCSFVRPDFPGRVVLDLGKVGDIACARLNGHMLPPLLIYPYAADITDYLRDGMNELIVEVTNSLRNGMIGAGMFSQPRNRAMSGLVGPVRLLGTD